MQASLRARLEDRIGASTRPKRERVKTEPELQLSQARTEKMTVRERREKMALRISVRETLTHSRTGAIPQRAAESSR